MTDMPISRETPIARLARRLVLWRNGERRCHVCRTQVASASAERVDGFYACSTGHADDIRRERAW